MKGEGRFETFDEFYPFYLSEHANRTSRRLHFVGTSFALVLLISAVLRATFKYPAFSLMGDGRLWWSIVTRKVPC